MHSPGLARVLIVDDEIELMAALSELLLDQGYDVVGCTSGEEALGVLRQREIDVLVTDLMMPGLDGIYLLRQAQALQPYLLGIVATGQGSIESAVDAMKVGAFDYVLKPFKLGTLLPILTRAVEVGRLKRDNLELRETVASRDAFISVAAHELKTPITSLLGAVQLLLRQQERGLELGSEQTARSLQIVQRQATKLGRLVAQLLEPSRLEAGLFEPDRRDVDLVAVVAAAVEQARATTERHEIVLGAPPRLAAFVDPIRIEQVIANLLDNAIKFSPDGGTIEVEVSTPAPETARLAVRDHGIGVPPEYRRDLFTRYYQAHAESHRSGLGLGLYISRTIVELHGGQIGLDPPADGGSRFVVDLPIGPVAADGQAAAAPQSHGWQETA
jgi:signal transduction histidine kinase